MKKLLLPLAALVATLVACDRPFPGVLQTNGDAPLVVDLDTTSPIVPGTELTFSLRGPNKGHGEIGGATGTFTAGVGSNTCLILDPENAWDGTYDDDGDIDLYAGRVADYNGQPGAKVGTFEGEWTDPLGIVHQIDANLCVQFDQFGGAGSHAGLATPEFCTMATTAGQPYLVLAKTFSVPTNDNVLLSSLVVLPGACPPIDECSLVKDNSGGVCGQP